MNRVNWQRWDPFREIQREMGRLFESIEPLPSWRVAQPFPVMNVYDAGDRYVLTVPIPGVNPEEIDLSITGETLTLRGERKRLDGVSDESYRRQERTFGRWTRTLTLPDRLDGTQVIASYANGVLIVSLPKAENARPRQIAVAALG